VIVTCQRCATQFQLDDSKIPASGIRVRCSRCKHAFFLEPAAGSQNERIHRRAREALEGDLPTTPDVSYDLASDPGYQEGEAESDWQFNEDETPDVSMPNARGRRPQPGDLAAARQAVDDLLDSSAPASDELGSPRDWDFFAEEADLTPSKPAQPPPGRVPAKLAKRPLRKRQRREPAEPLGRIRPGPAAATAGESPPSVRSRRAAFATGWAGAAALFLIGAYGGLAPRSPVAESAPGAQAVAGLEAEEVTARWVENAVAGPLFVVSGELRNPGPQTAVAGALIAVQLLDEAGVVLDGASAVLGPALPTAAVRERDPRELRQLQAEGARRLAWAPLAPGGRLAFHAVLADAPPAATRFRLEASPAPAPAPESDGGAPAPSEGESEQPAAP
jgi:predicted Zn finger-like uncharacterized protein